jgi:hypothetical protein
MKQLRLIICRRPRSEAVATTRELPGDRLTRCAEPAHVTQTEYLLKDEWASTGCMDHKSSARSSLHQREPRFTASQSGRAKRTRTLHLSCCTIAASLTLPSVPMASPLTPAVQLRTNAPFPIFRTEEGSEKPSLRPSPNEKIHIESCAEYMQFDIPGSKYGDSADFILLHDLEGQPMILSIGTDKVRRVATLTSCHADRLDRNSAFVYTSMEHQEAGRLSILVLPPASRLRSAMPARAQATRTSLLQSAAMKAVTSRQQSYTKSSLTVQS